MRYIRKNLKQAALTLVLLLPIFTAVLANAETRVVLQNNNPEYKIKYYLPERMLTSLNGDQSVTLIIGQQLEKRLTIVGLFYVKEKFQSYQTFDVPLNTNSEWLAFPNIEQHQLTDLGELHTKPPFRESTLIINSTDITLPTRDANTGKVYASIAPGQALVISSASNDSVYFVPPKSDKRIFVQTEHIKDSFTILLLTYSP